MKKPSTRFPKSRRAVATLVVLLLISIALALSYATMRSQSTAVQIQRNAHLATDARQAAITGLTMALKKMHTADWAGVGTTLSGSLGPGTSTGGRSGYDVTYTTGDPSLTQGHPDYADFPYRVTLVSVGYAADSSEPGRGARHTVRAVARLVPRKLSDEPSDWADIGQYTVYQAKKDFFEIDIPCQLAGPVRAQWKLRLARHYPNDSDAWSTYLTDLNRIRQSGQPDYRPLTGPVSLPYGDQDWKDILALQFNLGVRTVPLARDEVGSDWVKPTNLTDYQIYEGGPIYAIPMLPSTLENTTLEPDPLTNPLGLYYRNGNIELRDNVTIRGTLFCTDEISVVGSNVHFKPVDVPALYGSESPLRLPAATGNKFTIKPSAGGSLTGLLAVFDEFNVEKGPETTSFAITGRVVTKKLFIKERQPWETLNWKDYYDAFKIYAMSVWPSAAYFPTWMADFGRDPQPRVTVGPDPEPVTYHWQNCYNPVYVPHPDDATKLTPNRPGLRWELFDWTDNP